MDITEIMQTYYVPIVAGICFVIGLVVKHGLKFIPGKLIPAIVGICGLGINVAFNWNAVTFEVIVAGVLSGLSATGVHNLKKLFETAAE